MVVFLMKKKTLWSCEVTAIVERGRKKLDRIEKLGTGDLAPCLILP